MKLLRAYLATLDRIAPALAARTVYKVMSNPRVKKLREFENEVLDLSTKTTIPFNGFDIQTYTWGKPAGKTALMVHGWEGQAGNFGGIVPLLLERGYRVVAFDAPSHGHSSKGQTNMFDFIATVSNFIRNYEPELIISHSFGSISTAYALGENMQVPVTHWFLVTSPFSFKGRLDEIKNMANVTDRTINQLIRQFEADTKMKVAEMTMEAYCARIRNVSESTVIHSVDDKILSIDTSRAVHLSLPGSEMIELQKLGHYKILWSEELKNILANKLS